MERIKRQHNNDFYSNKKRKLNHTTPTIDTKKTRFEDFSNELFYEIFDYLDNYHVYQSFFNLNKRFQYFLLNSTLPIKINISIISKSSFTNYHNDIINPNKHRINILRLSNPFTVDIIFSPPRLILKFIRLEKLILDNIKSKYLENILNHLFYLPKLNSLIIHPIDFIQNPTLFYTQIFRLPKLKFCQIKYQTKDTKQSGLLFPAIHEFSPIEHLIINTEFSMDSFDNLLSYVPYLRHLTINSLMKSNERNKILSPMILKHLESVDLTLHSIRFSEFEMLTKFFFKNLQVLRISSSDDKGYLEAKRWEDLIISSMPNLQVFDIHHDAIGQISYNNNMSTFHELTDQFNSPFWIQRKWFFTHQHTCSTTLNSGLFYSTEPYRRKEHTFSWESDQQIDRCYQETDFNLVKRVNLNSTQIPDDPIDYFANATELTIEYNVNERDKSLVFNINRILPVLNLKKLNIKHCCFPFEQIIECLCFIPNLETLKFGSISFSRSNIMSIQQSDAFQFASRNNRLKNLDVRESCTLEYMEIIVNLFPRLEYLKTGLNRKEIDQTGRFLFSKINNKTYQLFFLCISYTPKIHLRKLKMLIKLEKLLDDYFVDLGDYGLYLWW